MKSQPISCEKQYSHLKKVIFTSVVNGNEKSTHQSQYKSFKNIESFFSADIITSRDFYKLIHKDYKNYYIEWMISFMKIYLNMNHVALKSSLRLFFPYKDMSGYYSWCMMRVSFDNLNSSADFRREIIFLSKKFQFVFISGEIWTNNAIDWELTKLLHKYFKESAEIKFSKSQTQILEEYKRNHLLTHADLANILNKSKNTIDVQCKQIVKKASEMCGFKFKNMKDFLTHLKEIDEITIGL